MYRYAYRTRSRRFSRKCTGKHKPKRLLIGISIAAAAALIVTAAVGIRVAMDPTLTYQGVPVSLILEFISDPVALKAYFTKDSTSLHARLQQMGIEEKIKAFYRPQIRDEVELDQYIHQLFYDLSGYVGAAYYVNPQGTLVLKRASEADFRRWYRLAYAAGIVVASRQQNGIYYVTSPAGSEAPYLEIAAIFPLEELEKLVDVIRQ